MRCLQEAPAPAKEEAPVEAAATVVAPAATVSSEPAPVVVPPPPPAGPAPRADGRVIATPYAKQLAKKHRVDLKVVGGSGPNGRITASDVERAAGLAPAAANGAAPVAAPSNGAVAPVPVPAAAPAAVAAAEAAGTTVAELRGTTTPFSAMEKSVAKNMQDSLKVAEFRATVRSPHQ